LCPENRAYIIVTLLITLLSGLAIWCFAKNGLHIGASALITGYWAFIVTDVYQHTTPITIILAALSVYYFAGIFLGIFPKEKGVSWQGHLFGLLAGIASNYLLKFYPQF
jgi:membrane associated rhomboid family serine protease